MSRVVACLLAMVLTGRAILAQERAPTCSAREHRQFDFWLGKWEVTDSAGRERYGVNEITREENGCLIHERWHGAQGGSGQSLNFYDRRQGRWAQVWVASTGNVLRLAGSFDGTRIVLEGGGDSAAEPTRNRIVWTPQSDGRVRQLWSSSADGGKTWRVVFDGWYRKVPGS